MKKEGLATLEIAQHIRYVGAASNVEDGLNVEVIVRILSDMYCEAQVMQLDSHHGYM